MLKIFTVLLLYCIKDATLQSCEAEDKYAWSYHGPENGPEHWGDSYSYCNEMYQSPIAITEKNTVQSKYPQLHYEGFDEPITKAKVENLGWTVMVTPDDDVDRFVVFGATPFNLENIHFHFGTKSNPGAEHSIDGVKYPMEMHFFTRSESLNIHPAIVAVLMDGDDDDNSAFGPITDILSDVKYRGDSTELGTDIVLSNFLPENNGSYYYYHGSDSIPRCQPGYIWWILKGIGKVGNNQLDTFMTLYSVGKDDASDECLMGPNYRPEQNLENRSVKISK